MIAYNFQSLSLANFLATAQRVVTSMTGNEFFPEPWAASAPSLTQLNADLAGFGNAYAATASGDRTKVAERDIARATLANDLRLLGLFVELVANGDESMLATTGFTLRSRQPRSIVVVPLPAPENLTVNRGEVSGLLIAQVKKLPKAASYEVEITAADPTVESNWTAAGNFSGCRRMELSGLTSLKTYSVRVRGLNSAGPGAWSAPSSIIVL